MLRQFLVYSKWTGVSGALRTVFGKMVGAHPRLALLGRRPPFHIRARSSDLIVCMQVFEKREYECRPPQPVRTIIDAGANIGVSAVFFASEFPEARILCVEADAANYELLLANTRHYENIECVHAALWHHNGTVVVQDTGMGAWAMRAVEASTDGTTEGPALQQIQAVTLSDLMSKHSVGSIDILKIDIEGGEKDLFHKTPRLLDRVNILTIECHDRWISGCTQAVIEATRDFAFEWVRGENLFFCREGWLPEDTLAARIERCSHTRS